MGHYDRRSFLQQSAATLATLAASGNAAGAASARRPNILFILADDLGWGDVSCYGNPGYRTPAIDRLCAEGLKATAAYANSSTCSPTRVALMSGRYQYRLPVGLYDPLPPTKNLGFPSDHPSLPSLLKRAGYRTGLVGKWHLGELPSYGPLKSGYDEFFGLMGAAMDYFNHDTMISANGAMTMAPALYEGEKLVEVEGYSTDLFTDRAVEFVQREHEDPFFLSLHYTAPHWPWQGPEDRAVKKLNLFHYDGGSRETFGEMVLAMDRGIGRVLDALSKRGANANTLVVFTSDNGGERFSQMWPFRGEKFELWEGGIRVPCIVRWPGRIPAGSTTDQVMITMDWLPTLTRAAGLQPDTGYPSDGLDLAPMLTGAVANRERTVFWRTNTMGAARHGIWKYVQEGKHEYLFNLAQDTLERANLKLHEPEVFGSLQEQFARWNGSMLPVPEDASMPPGAWEAIQALEPWPPVRPAK